MKFWIFLIDRKWLWYWDSSSNRVFYDDFGIFYGNGEEIDIFYDGYFWGFFMGGDGFVVDVRIFNGNGGEYDNGNNCYIWRFYLWVVFGSYLNGNSYGWLYGCCFVRDYYNYEILFGCRFGV